MNAGYFDELMVFKINKNSGKLKMRCEKLKPPFPGGFN
jgi:hypothetical protein